MYAINLVRKKLTNIKYGFISVFFFFSSPQFTGKSASVFIASWTNSTECHHTLHVLKRGSNYSPNFTDISKNDHWNFRKVSRVVFESIRYRHCLAFVIHILNNKQYVLIYFVILYLNKNHIVKRSVVYTGKKKWFDFVVSKSVSHSN